MRSVRYFLVFLVFVLASPESWSSPMVHDWSQHYGDANNQLSEAVAVDAWGNIIVTGVFLGSVDFGGGVLPSAGGYDVFLAKFDANGGHLWSYNFGDASHQYCYGVAVDDLGNVILAGYFNDTIDFGGSLLTSAGGEDIFLAKFTAGGAHIWSKRFGETSNQRCYDVAVDASRNISITGYYYDSVDFGGGMFVSEGGYDAYVAKFDAGGTHMWSRNLGASMDQFGYGIAVDGSGNVAVTGEFNGTVDFGGGGISSAGGYDVYVAKYKSNGAYLWSHGFGDANSQSCRGIAADQAGNTFLAGEFNGTVNFGGGNLTSAGGDDIFVAKFGPVGVHQWSKRFGNVSEQTGRSVAADESGNAIVAGYFYGTLDFGGGNLASAGTNDIFVAKFDADGEHVWSMSAGDPGHQHAYDVAVDDRGNAYVTGDMSGSADFGGGVLTSTGGYDAFIAKFWRASPVIQSVRDVPGDEGGFVNVSWDGSGADTPVDHGITRYTVWRAIDPSIASAMIDGGAVLVSEPPAAATTAEPIIRVEEVAGTPYYWYLVETVSAYYLPGYSAPVPTLFDSTGTSTENHYFQVIAHTPVSYVFYTSDPASGYSVDNLAPAAPLGLAGAQSAAAEIELTWQPNTEPDLSHYAVYRGTDPGFVPSIGNRIGITDDESMIDAGWTWDGGYWYKVTALDVHGNESTVAVLGPDVVSAAGESPPAQTTLAQNRPNPFNPTTTISFGLREGGDVTLRIFDATGRLVTTIVDRHYEAGRYEAVWNGRDDLGRPVASGVYFYRLDTGTSVFTRKMILLK